MRKHALLSASGASRWMGCPPSARLEDYFDDTTSIYAEEGTTAHELSELKVIKALVTPNMSTADYGRKLAVIKTSPHYSKEMENYTDMYLDFIKEKVIGAKGYPVVAVEKRLDYSIYAHEGFGTADCLIVAGNKLTVVDFKYGKGVEVSAERNPQMMLYGLGALELYRILFDIKTVELCVIQPRIENFSEWEISAEELVKWGTETVKPLADKAFKGEGKFSSGEHCRFCKAKAVCKTRAEENAALHTFVEVPILELDETLGDDKLSELLDKAKDLAKWQKDLEEYALNRCLQGKPIPRWKAVEGRSNRKFKDIDKAIDILAESGIDRDMLYERKPLTLTAMEKLTGKKEFGDLLADVIEKPPGRPALVKEDDKRPAISLKTSAVEDFK